MIQDILEYYKIMGIDDLTIKQEALLEKKPAQPKKNSVIKKNSAKTAIDKANSITELEDILNNFNDCQLKETANSTVFFDGHTNAKILVIGEAPGATEDEQGVPFCGESGKLLMQMLEQINLKRAENFLISNIVFWRPPGNRKPTNEEISQCLPFLEKLIALMQPELILLIGATAASAMLKTKEAITELRNINHQYSNQYLEKPIDSFVLFHPSYLIRQGAQKKKAWFDLLKLKQHMKEKKIKL